MDQDRELRRMGFLHLLLQCAVRWNYEEEIEKLKHTPLYADGRYDAAVGDFKAELDAGKKKEDINTIAIAHNHFDPEYNKLSYVKKAELLTNIEHMRVDTIAH